MRNWIYLFLVTFVIIVACCGCGGGGSKGATVSGKVINGGTEAPLSGVRVSIGTISATSKSDGSFTLSNVPTGSKTVSAQLSGYETTVMTITVVAGSNGPIIVMMAPETGNPPPPPDWEP